MASVDLYADVTSTSSAEARLELWDKRYLPMLQALWPRGLVWARTWASRMAKFFDALGQELARVERRGRELLLERDPRSATETLDDWEYHLGLPDIGSGPTSDLAQRRLEAHAKFIARGDPSFAHFEELAAALGYTVEVSTGSPFTCQSECDDPLIVGDTVYKWRIIGASQGAEKDARLQRILQAAGRAHILLVFELS